MKKRLSIVIAALLPLWAHAHGTEARYVEVVDWKKEHVARVFAASTVHFLGMQDEPLATPTARGSFRTSIPVQAKEVNGRSCLLGQLLAFDIDDAYAFDLDETVAVTLTFATEYSSSFYVAWDKSGGTGSGMSAAVTPDAAPGFQTLTIPLERARLAGQGTHGADLAIGTRNGIMLCDFEIARSHTTPAVEAYGTVRLTFEDAKTGRAVPARVGLYDSTGRAPLASSRALMLQRFADDLRMLAVNERTFWPSENRQAFYVDGTYEAKVPVGTYELVATRGPEFKAWRGTVEVRSDSVTTSTVALERYADLPARGWYSGDAHIHVTRDAAADPSMSGFVAAEDVHVGNFLEMGNIASLHFEQRQDWGGAGQLGRDGYFAVSGQENPRTGHFGHTIHLNLQHPIRPQANEYFLYDQVFAEARRQGGVSGFASMGFSQSEGQEPQMNRALTLLAPTGLVDFVEVLQAGRFVTDGWYRLLNLGLRVYPAAGSEWPYGDLPGVARNFVKVDGPLSPDAWFESYRAGHTYVTNAPFLELTVNGKDMGEELRVARGAVLDIVAATELNPDVGALDRLELVALGEVIDSVSAAGRDRIVLEKTLVADRSMWMAVRSFGSRQRSGSLSVAHSAPIYVVVDDEPTWNRAQLPTIVGDLRFQLSRMLNEEIPPIVNAGPEPWETRALTAEHWLLQRPLLKPRIERADAAYQQLIADFEKIYGPGSGTTGARPIVREKVEEDHDH
jgi:hypothetical protein